MLPSVGAPLRRLHGVTFLCTPSDEVNASVKLILSIFV